MARTTHTKVADILESQPGETALTPFIRVANIVVTEYLTSITNANLLEEIERWLSAHYYSVALDPDVTEEKIGQTSNKFAGEFGFGFMASRYGQMAVSLDNTGTLSRLSNPDRRSLRFKIGSAMGPNGQERVIPVNA